MNFLAPLCFLTFIAAQPAPRSLAEERAWLKEAKTAELKRLTAIIDDAGKSEDARMVALYEAAALRSPESIKVLERVYDKPFIQRDAWRQQLEIIRMAGAYVGSEDAVPLLMKASKTSGFGGDERWNAAQGLSQILGARALPRLREMREDSNDTVRAMVRVELAKLGDKQAIGEILADVEAGLLSGIEDAGECHVTQALPALRICWRAVNDDRRINLKMRACLVALSLGDKDSVKVMIDMVGKDVSNLGVPTPRRALAAVTKVDLGDDRAVWLAWWDKDGKNQPPFGMRMEPGDKQAIARAVLDWARTEKSGPFLPTKVVYLTAGPNLKALESESVRLYSGAEIKLLGQAVNRDAVASLHGYSTNGQRAFVVLSRPGTPVGTHSFDVELRRTKDVWQVVGAAKRPVFE